MASSPPPSPHLCFPPFSPFNQIFFPLKGCGATTLSGPRTPLPSQLGPQICLDLIVLGSNGFCFRDFLSHFCLTGFGSLFPCHPPHLQSPSSFPHNCVLLDEPLLFTFGGFATFWFGSFFFSHRAFPPPPEQRFFLFSVPYTSHFLQRLSFPPAFQQQFDFSFFSGYSTFRNTNEGHLLLFSLASNLKPFLPLPPPRQ